MSEKRSPQDNVSGGEGAASSWSWNPLTWLGNLFSNRGKELLAVGILSIVSLVAYASWDALKQRLNDYIITIAVDELNRDDSRLFSPIGKVMRKLRESEVGSLKAGSFWLTPSNRAYTLYLYFPKGYKGKLFYRLKGVSDRKYVVLVLPDGTNLHMKNTEASINLAQYVDVGSTLEAQGIEGIIERPGALRDLHGITFQLAGEEADEPVTDDLSGTDDNSTERVLATSGIEVNYVSFIAPAIHIEK